jgi:hypothetical protein
MARIVFWSAAALLAFGIAAAPSEAPAPNGPSSLCGDKGAVLSFFGGAAFPGPENVCTAQCRRALGGCRALVRRVLTCENALLRAEASVGMVGCRRAASPKDIRECRASIREQVAGLRNDREDILNALSQCGEAVGDCGCDD